MPATPGVPKRSAIQYCFAAAFKWELVYSTWKCHRQNKISSRAHLATQLQSSSQPSQTWVAERPAVRKFVERRDDCACWDPWIHHNKSGTISPHPSMADEVRNCRPILISFTLILAPVNDNGMGWAWGELHISTYYITIRQVAKVSQQMQPFPGPIGT